MYVNIENWLHVLKATLGTMPTKDERLIAEIEFILQNPELISLVTDIFHTGDVQAKEGEDRTMAILAAANHLRQETARPIVVKAGKDWGAFTANLPTLLRLLLTLTARR